jgi:uncharacterized protein
MILPDANLILYAYDRRSPFHRVAARWWTTCLNGSETVAIPSVVLFSVIRLATSAHLFVRPFRFSEITAEVKKWLSRPNCEVLYPATGHVERAIALVTQSGGGGNLSTDAQIAALALEHLATVHTADLDFQRFQGLRWYNPITGGKSS